MSTHRRAWMVRAGVVVVVAAAGLFGFAAPALAADPTVTITSLSTGALNAGETATLKFTVRNNNLPPGEQQSATIKISFSGFQGGEISCQGNCDFTQAINSGTAAPEFTATLRAGNVPAGTTRNGQVKIRATIAQDSAEVPRDLSVQGPAQQQPTAAAVVPEVSGKVVDVYTGTPIAAARVFMQDSANTLWDDVGTDQAGNFKIVSQQNKPIKPGTLAISVEKDGLQAFKITKTGVAGQPLTGFQLTVVPAASPTPSVLPGASDGVPGNTVPVDALNTDAPAASVDSGGLSWILIAVGGLLVALGIGAIVLLFVRKKNDGTDEEEDADGRPRPPRQGGPGQGPPGRGGPRPPQRRGGPPEMAPPMRGPGNDPTRQMRPPVSPGPRGDQTMISPSPLANAPTQLHSRIPPEHADPYGAPPPRHNGAQPGYGQNSYGPTGGYGQPQPPSYGGPPPTAYPGGAPPQYGQQPDPYAPQGYGPNADPYGQPPAYGPNADPYGPQGYGPQGRDPRGPRPERPPPQGGDGRRVDWLDD